MIKLHDSFPATLTGLDLVIGDSAKLLASVPPDTIDLVVTSPPYDGLRTYNGYCFDFETIAQQLYRVVKPGGVVVWIVGDATVNGSETGTSFRQALYFKECGFNLHDTMIYAKSSYMPLTHNRYEQAWEFMFVFSKGKPSTFNPIMVPCVTVGTTNNRDKSKQQHETAYAARAREEKTIVKSEKQHANIFFYAVGMNDKTTHTAPFPEQLVADAIVSWSKTDDLVLDPFSGSGTTGKMCVLGGRNFLGFEISKEYALASEKRINYVAAQLKMF